MIVNVFSAGMNLIQFVSSLFFVFCWSTPIGRASRDFVVGWCLVFKASKSLLVSSRSRSPSWRLFHFPPTRPLRPLSNSLFLIYFKAKAAAEKKRKEGKSNNGNPSKKFFLFLFFFCNHDKCRVLKYNLAKSVQCCA